jgi:hypothetical protein
MDRGGAHEKEKNKIKSLAHKNMCVILCVINAL